MKVLDTTFLIDLIRGDEDTLKILNSDDALLTTQINMYEVIRGLFLRKVTSSKLMEVIELFENVRLLSLDDNSIIKAADISANLIKKGKIISDCDCLMAGMALTSGANKIVTRNRKHFSRITELEVIDY
tara:strand:+ start:26341 stop:26727 length:387 start_codon:yes stop_codon:yes gene_type:complete